MITFKKMWDDVQLILSKKNYSDINILEKFEGGFIVKEKEEVTFITRDDIIDFWCKLSYYNELSLNDISNDDKVKPKYIYSIIKQLPYVSENSCVINLLQ